MLEEDQRKLQLHKILRHEKDKKAEKEACENKVRLEKIQLIDELVAAFNRTRNVDKRMPLIICTKTYMKNIKDLEHLSARKKLLHFYSRKLILIWKN